MRNPTPQFNAHFLHYGIREIVQVANQLQLLDPEFRVIAENIGDPIAKGWHVPSFLIREIIRTINPVRGRDDHAFGYVHSHGVRTTREWVVESMRKINPDLSLTSKDVLFFNGLGSAIAILYTMLPESGRVLTPAPAYPSHTSFESFAAKKEPLTYLLDPKREWEIDLEDLEKKIKKNPDVIGITVINPNNPTGAVFTKKTLKHVVKLAEKYQLFLISDEVYFRMVYGGKTHTHLMNLAHNRVPLIVMRGSSKDIPWPGGRCGWAEFYNRHLDPDFDEYAKAIEQAVLIEVCATSLPQYVLPHVYDHPKFPKWIEKNNQFLEENVTKIHKILKKTEGLMCNMTYGAFYMMPLFKPGVLKSHQTLPIKNRAARTYIEDLVAKPGVALDKRFCYYLLAATGICTVPATDFYSPNPGFRITTLERSPKKLESTYQRLSKAVTEYLKS